MRAEGALSALRAGNDAGREFLVLSQGAWTCQRSVRFDDWLCIRTYHDGYHALPELMLFDLANDPHEQVNLAEKRQDVVSAALARLDGWHADMMRDHPKGVDPMWTVLREGGPWHVRGHLDDYLERLRSTGRADWAERLRAEHPGESASGASARTRDRAARPGARSAGGRALPDWDPLRPGPAKTCARRRRSSVSTDRRPDASRCR